MNLRIRKLLPILLIAIIVISCFSGCSSEPKNAVSKKYKTLPYGDYVMRATNLVNHPINLYFGDAHMLTLSTFEEYEAASIYDLERDEEFFGESALLVIKYEHTSSDEPIELVDIAIKDGKIYPVVSMELPPEHDITADEKTTLIIADVKKSDVEKYSFGEVLAINLADENDGSVYHEKFE